MKKLIILLFCCLTIVACASKTEHQIKIGQDTKELGEAYINQGNYTAALRKLLEAEKIIPDDPYLHYDLGFTYMAKNRYGLAQKHFEKAIKLNPEYIPAKNSLGGALLKQEKWDEAIACFTEISENLLYTTPYFATSNLGWAYLGKKEYRMAKENFAKALKIRPDFINAAHGLATTYLETGQAHIARFFLEKTIKKNPDAAILHSDLAKTHEALKQFAHARQSWQTVINLAPGSPLAEEADRRIRSSRP